MSLLKWKERAKRKSELGNMINFVHNTIWKNHLGEKTSQELLTKVFKGAVSHALRMLNSLKSVQPNKKSN